MAMLHKWTTVGRMISWGTFLVFALSFYALLVRLTNRPLWSCLMTLLFLTTRYTLEHVVIIRPELATLTFFLLSWHCAIHVTKHHSPAKNGFILFVAMIGLLWGLAIWSKIQIIPILGIFLVGFLYVIYQKGSQLQSVQLQGKTGLMPLIIWPAINLMLCPWWAFRKPSFLTHSYLQNLSDLSFHKKVYQNNLPDYWIIPLVFLILLFIVGMITSIRFKGRCFEPIMAGLRSVVLALNGLLLGLLSSIYIILIPVSTTLQQYMNNTQRLVNFTLTNIVHRSYLNEPNVSMDRNQIFASETWQAVFDNINQWAIGGIPFLYVIIVTSLLALVRVIFSDNKKPYFAVLLLFFSAWLMVYLGLVRDPIWRPYYDIYKYPLFGLGLAT
jgi:hypothetical protein